MKVSQKYWDDLKEFEREYIRQRQNIDSVHELKLKINAARRQYPSYINIYGKGFIVLPDGTELLWSGSDTKTYNLIEPKMENQNKSEAEIIAEIENKVKQSCIASHYESLCQRIQTPAGLAYVVNRCIGLMAKNNMHLSACLAQLEAEEEGLD